MYMEKLRTNLLGYVEYDEYALLRPEREYTVRSIYLDSYDYKCYYEKLDGTHTRRKFRIRGYNRKEGNSKVFFEIKRKNENFVSKDRALVPFQVLDDSLGRVWSTPVRDEEDRKYLNNFHYYYDLERLEPKVLVVYDREPFQCKFGSALRITFDKNLRCRAVSGYESLYEEQGLMRLMKHEFVLEIKFYQVLPRWIDRVIGKFNLTRLSVSKYTSSIDGPGRSTMMFNKFIRNDFTNRMD